MVNNKNKYNNINYYFCYLNLLHIEITIVKANGIYVIVRDNHKYEAKLNIIGYCVE